MMSCSSSSSLILQKNSSFSSINKTRHHFYYYNHQKNNFFSYFPIIPSQVGVSLSGDGSNLGRLGSQTKTTLSYTSDASTGDTNESPEPYVSTDDENSKDTSGLLQEHTTIEPKKAAKIHDFCLGIPFGGIVLAGGLAGFTFTRNLSILSTGVLYGGALLALSTFSLKVWLHGKSSLPFILGQTALSVALLRKNFQTYSLSKKLFPEGFYVFLSAAMICFYSYVMLSGGNPPPKKLKSSVVASS